MLSEASAHRTPSSDLPGREEANRSWTPVHLVAIEELLGPEEVERCLGP